MFQKLIQVFLQVFLIENMQLVKEQALNQFREPFNKKK